MNKKIVISIDLIENSTYEESDEKKRLGRKQVAYFGNTQYITNPIKQYVRLSTIK